MIEQMPNESLVVAGDGRCDSPGKCAKFCTYTIMEVSTNIIIHSETVDKREVQNRSPNMEREGASRALSYLKDKVNIVEMTTDASTSVTNLLGRNVQFLKACTYYAIYYFIACEHPTVYHSMDIWHKSKLLKKVLTNVSDIRKLPMHIYLAWSI